MDVDAFGQSPTRFVHLTPHAARGYGSDASASRSARLVGDKIRHPLGCNVVKPPNDPNQTADRASCRAISGDIGSAGGGTDLFPSTPSLARTSTAGPPDHQ